jgi:hypothetical protein
VQRKEKKYEYNKYKEVSTISIVLLLDQYSEGIVVEFEVETTCSETNIEYCTMK